jgi:hypothetical protein
MKEKRKDPKPKSKHETIEMQAHLIKRFLENSGRPSWSQEKIADQLDPTLTFKENKWLFLSKIGITKRKLHSKSQNRLYDLKHPKSKSNWR